MSEPREPRTGKLQTKAEIDKRLKAIDSELLRARN
jgi:chromosome segregation ATPase